MRVFITGFNCSGKSFTGKLIAEAIEAPVVSLDNIHYSDVATESANAASERLKQVRSILTWDSWVVEGRWLSWTEALRDSADVVVVLEPSRVRMVWRLTVRFFRQTTKKPLRNLLMYAGSVWRYRSTWIPELDEALSKVDSGKIRRVQNARDAIEVVAGYRQ